MSAVGGPAAVAGDAEVPTPAQLYLWIWGAALLILGVGSLLVHPNFSVGDDIRDERLFGAVETNGWHGLAGASAGAVSLAFARSRRRAAAVAAGVGIGAGVVPAIVFLISGDDSIALGLIPVDVTDAVLLHLIPGVIGALCAAAPSSRQSFSSTRISP